MVASSLAWLGIPGPRPGLLGQAGSRARWLKVGIIHQGPAGSEQICEQEEITRSDTRRRRDQLETPARRKDEGRPSWGRLIVNQTRVKENHKRYSKFWIDSFNYAILNLLDSFSLFFLSNSIINSNFFLTALQLLWSQFSSFLKSLQLKYFLWRKCIP